YMNKLVTTLKYDVVDKDKKDKPKPNTDHDLADSEFGPSDPSVQMRPNESVRFLFVAKDSDGKYVDLTDLPNLSCDVLTPSGNVERIITPSLYNVHAWVFDYTFKEAGYYTLTMMYNGRSINTYRCHLNEAVANLKLS